MESAKEGDLIAEYVGELIHEPTTCSRQPVSIHLRRNYLFQLNLDLTIDSLYAGNDARFINHASDEHANARAKVLLVNGEHRIGIYAKFDIEAGTEVRFNYGPEFFKNEEGKGAIDIKT